MTEWEEVIIDGGLIMITIVIAAVIIGALVSNPKEAMALIILGLGFLITSVIAGYLAHHLPEQVAKWK